MTCAPSVHDSHLALSGLQITDDDGQQIIEIMGDAAGKLADGFELLRLAKSFFGRRASVDLCIEMAGSPQNCKQRQEKYQCYRDAVDQMRRHRPDQLIPDGRRRNAARQIKRRRTKAAVGKAPPDVIDWRRRRIDTAAGGLLDRSAKTSMLVQPGGCAGWNDRIAR